LEKHRRWIVNYEQLSTQKVCSIGSGAVESAVKQIDRRLKISGAQRLMKNVNQMRSLRCTLTDQYPFDAQKRKTGMLPERQRSRRTAIQQMSIIQLCQIQLRIDCRSQ